MKLLDDLLRDAEGVGHVVVSAVVTRGYGERALLLKYYELLSSPSPSPKSKSKVSNPKSRGKGLGLGLTI